MLNKEEPVSKNRAMTWLFIQSSVRERVPKRLSLALLNLVFLDRFTTIDVAYKKKVTHMLPWWVIYQPINIRGIFYHTFFNTFSLLVVKLFTIL
jgi:hypothetical protein